MSKMMFVHFIGVTKKQLLQATLVWGGPDFTHRWHDWRSHGDIDWENDKSIVSSPVEDMLFDFCKTLERSEIVVLTHITSPFLKKQTIFDAVDMLQNDQNSKSIHSVHKIQDFVWVKKENEIMPINFKTDRVQQTQDLSPIFVSKGAFFIAKAGDILDQRKRLPEPLLFFSLDHQGV